MNGMNAWQEKLTALEGAYTDSIVRLMIDGYAIAVQRTRVSKTRDGFMVFINGAFSGAWLVDDCEERRRFMRPCSTHVFKGSRRAALKKLRGKQYKDMLNKRFTYYQFYWTSIASLIRHLTRHNTHIALVSEEPNHEHPNTTA